MKKEILTAGFLFLTTLVFGQMTVQEIQVLKQFAKEQEQKYLNSSKVLNSKAAQLGIPLVLKDEEGQEYGFLKNLDENNIPEYTYLRNQVSQTTIGVDKVKNGGSANLDLSGSGVRLGIWDGDVRITHQEFSGRISRGDTFGGTLSNHGTHVTGTVGATGVDASAQGMSHAATLRVFNTNNDISEMANEAAASNPIVASNHSYGPDYGWVFLPTGWDWIGGNNQIEDWRHGAYLQEAIAYDQVARNAPFYSIVVAAGNEQTNGTANAHTHGGSGNFTDFHPIDGVGGDCLPNDATAKNVITVGNALAIPGGYAIPGDVVLSQSSSVGPPDDGRIKPDLVAQGNGVYSSEAASNANYDFMSGTSMSAPAITGSIGLLTQHWSNTHSGSSPLRAATMKALLIHTTDEAGPAPGPDYRFGWGLANIERAARVISLDGVVGCRNIYEASLGSASSYQFSFDWNGQEPITATLVWTDLAGPQSTSGVIDEPTRRLVNDLDMKITKSTTTFRPYVLNPNSPNNPATTGINNRDNVEKIYIANPTSGTYTLNVSPNGSISSGPQNFSIILTGNASITISRTISSGSFNSDASFHAKQRITMTGSSEVINGGNLDLKAGGYIEFTPSFKTINNGKLIAKPTNNTCTLE